MENKIEKITKYKSLAKNTFYNQFGMECISAWGGSLLKIESTLPDLNDKVLKVALIMARDLNAKIMLNPELMSLQLNLKPSMKKNVVIYFIFC